MTIEIRQKGEYGLLEIAQNSAGEIVVSVFDMDGLSTIELDKEQVQKLIDHLKTLV